MISAIFSLMAQLSKLLAPYFSEMSLMFTATLLVIYGDIINGNLKRMLAPYHFLVRTVVFVLLCAFGYGALTLYGTPLVLSGIKLLPWHWQGVVVVAAFITLGFLAERRRYM